MDDELLNDFIVEANEHMADIENQFLSIEESGEDVDVDLINEVFRGIHSIKGAAGFLGMTTINDLAHSLENILNMMRNLELTPNSAMIDVMLRAADRLQGLINDIQNSNDADVSEFIQALESISNDKAEAAPEPTPAVQEKPLTEDEELDRQIEEAIAAKLAETNAKKEATEKPPQQEAEPPVEPTPAPSPEAKKPTPTAKKSKDKKTAAPEASIRVSIGVLDKLMNLAGELVLSRNQLMQAIVTTDRTGLDVIASRLDQVTSEVQESIMQTRMQQIGSVFGKFPRIVRDLSSKLGKHCNLNIEGKEVEVDKTIIEAIGDPLTHLVRNSIDHGIEMPEGREKAGKPVEGTMNLRAFYQAGKVRIEIEDDGAGIDPKKLKEKAVSKGILTAEKAEQMNDREAVRLIFHPGFSMAAKVTDVSGRGVGMDVVRTNISKLGGTVDVESVVGQGTNIVITLPLTLAIIPSLIVQSREDRFAIPQVNIAELVRLRPAELEKRVGRIKDSEVLRLRGDLLPLIRLEEVLGMASKQGADEEQAETTAQPICKATNIIVVETGQHRFGVVVDALHDSEEIVVKPLGRHIQECPCLSGATILGDGHVALILDVAGIAAHEQVLGNEALDQENEKQTGNDEEETQHMLLFSNHAEEHFAVTMDVISRIDRVRADQIDSVGGQELLQYRNSTMSLLRLENCITAKMPEPGNRLYVIVFEVAGKEVGLIAPLLEDIRDITSTIDTATFRERGILGSMVLGEKTTRYVDLFELADIAHPEWRDADDVVAVEEDEQPPLILLAEDSGFFRKQVTGMMTERGYRVVDCEDGLIAWETLQSGEHDFDLVVTDIEMPNMDGFELADRIKQSSKWNHLPVIALTSLAGAADVERGIEVGIDDYQIKMDRDKLLNSLQNFAGTKSGNNRPVLEKV
ncbi:MAG: hybrid sensor histidine kinase/response regulator [Planctomycetes bacterium]|nr:hybrid sensor histidine kinase/response regulator [Planctomycetota bacterium]